MLISRLWHSNPLVTSSMLRAGAICHSLRVFSRCAPRVAQQLVAVRAADASARAGRRPVPVRGPRDDVLDGLLHHAAALQAARRAAPRATPRRRVALHAAHSRDAQAHDADADSVSTGGWWRARRATRRRARRGTAGSGQGPDRRGPAGGNQMESECERNETRSEADRSGARTREAHVRLLSPPRHHHWHVERDGCRGPRDQVLCTSLTVQLLNNKISRGFRVSHK